MEIRLSDDRVVPLSPGESLYDALKKSGIFLVASCGGKGVCGKCRVRLLEGRARSESTAKLTREDIRSKIVLACSTFPEEDVLVEIPEESRLLIGDKIAAGKTKPLLDLIFSYDALLTPPVRRVRLQLDPPTIENNRSDLERITQALANEGIEHMIFPHAVLATASKMLRDSGWTVTLAYTEDHEAVSLSPADTGGRYGLAVDIGTTTIVLYLVNLEDGQVISTGMTYNSQMRHGDDVITRIVYATEGGGLHELRNAVVNDINNLLHPLVETARIDRNAIETVMLAGNTTMSQLFWGLDPASIREEPYVPAIHTYPVWKAKTAKIRINSEAPVRTIPCIGSYVGGDIVAGVLASGMHRNEEIALFMDIGTNGEIVIGNKEWLITAACSAGPCFEGSGIRNGMRATEGAIEEIRIGQDGFEPELAVIGGTNPVGICGSGMIDAISEFFRAGIIDQKGKFVRDLRTDRIMIGEEGPEFLLHRGRKDIVLTEVDIENILRAKAAIYAGVAVLLKEVGLSLDVVEKIYIAGGFGNYLDIDKAIMIGMLPDVAREKFSFIGNSSLAGAYLCLLSEKMRHDTEEIARKMTYVELSVSRNFMDEYMSSLFLPHTNIDLFPSVREMYNRNATNTPRGKERQ